MTLKAENAHDYRAAIAAVHVAMRLLSQWDLEQLLDDMQYALDFGPFVDPTRWIEKHEVLEQDKALIKSALPLFRAAKALGVPRVEPLT